MARPKAAYGIAALARELNLHPKFVRRQLAAAGCPVRKSGSGRNAHAFVWLSDLREYLPDVLDCLLEIQSVHGAAS